MSDSGDQSDPPPGLAHRGVIRDVRGRAVGRGVPEAFSLSIETSNGDVISAGMPVARPMVAVPAQPMYEVHGPAERFARCPICLSENPASREHVPPRAIGGRPLVFTCERCNNDFGRAEADMVRWYRGAVELRIRGDGVLGYRTVGDVLVRPTTTGQVLLMTTSDMPPETLAIFESGTGRFLSAEPDVARIQASVAKTAYLVTCAFLGNVPDTPRAQALREELVTVRDTRRREPLELGPALSSIRVFRGPSEPETGRVTLVRVPALTPNEYWIGLNDSVFVAWPLEVELLAPWIQQFDDALDDNV